MATTLRKTSRGRQRQAPSARPQLKREAAVKRANGGAGDAAGDGPVRAKTAKRADKTGKSDRIVRDTFKMPQREFALIDELKQRCRALGVEVKKSDVLRAGLLAMRDLSDERLGQVVRPMAAARTERAARRQAKAATPA